jgi:hypothetical protein
MVIEKDLGPRSRQHRPGFAFEADLEFGKYGGEADASSVGLTLISKF